MFNESHMIGNTRSLFYNLCYEETSNGYSLDSGQQELLPLEEFETFAEKQVVFKRV